MHTLVLDLKNLAFRAGWANKNLTAPGTGEPIGPLYGILRMLTSALNRFPDVNKLVLAADPIVDREPHWRKIQFPGYKEFRQQEATDDQVLLRKAVARNLEKFRNMAAALPCVWLEDPASEADDLIAYYAAMTEPHEQVTIVSRDWDLMQLAAYPNVTVAYPKDAGFHLLQHSNFPQAIDPLLRKRANNPKTWSDLPITPRLYLVMKSWIGDKSDGIDGLQRVKEATAKKMLQLIVDTYGAKEVSANPVDAFKTWWRACEAKPKGPTTTDRTIAGTPDALEIIARNYRLMVLIDGVAVQQRHSFQGVLDENTVASWLTYYGFESLLQEGSIAPMMLAPLRRIRHA